MDIRKLQKLKTFYDSTINKVQNDSKFGSKKVSRNETILIENSYLIYSKRTISRNYNFLFNEEYGKDD